MAVDCHNGATVAHLREQTVEISLGPKRVFEDDNLGALTRRVPGDQFVSAVPRRRGNPKRSRGPWTPRVVELLRKAIEWQYLLESGDASSQAEIARQECITRARVTQVMALMSLAPEIRRHILEIPDNVRRPGITERALRPIAGMENLTDQIAKFEALIHPLCNGKWPSG